MTNSSETAFAFPQSADCSGGLTKREYYAACAPITLEDARESLRDSGYFNVTDGQVLRRLAKMRFEYADAMAAAGKESA
jgi:hypothetical protein